MSNEYIRRIDWAPISLGSVLVWAVLILPFAEMNILSLPLLV